MKLIHKFKSKYRFLTLLIFLLSVFGCAKDDYYKLEAAYYKKDYIKVGELALKKENFKHKKTNLFFKKFGDTYVKKALEKGENFDETTISKAHVEYLEELDHLLVEFRNLNFPILNIDTYIKTSSFLLNKAQNIFVEKSILLGKENLQRKAFRQAHTHFSNALFYSPNLSDIITYQDMAFEQAKITISIAPFFSESIALNDQFKQLFKAIQFKQPLPAEVYKSPIIIKGENFLEKIRKETIKQLEEKKSKFLVLSDFVESNSNIVVAVAIGLTEEDRTQFPTISVKTSFIDYIRPNDPSRTWLTDSFEYEVIKKSYKLSSESNIKFYSTGTNAPFNSKTITQQASETQLTRGKILTSLPQGDDYRYPTEYQLLTATEHPFSKDYVLEELIHKTANVLSDYIIQLVDQ